MKLINWIKNNVVASILIAGLLAAAGGAIIDAGTINHWDRAGYHTWPAEKPVGLIYSKSSWSNTADFQLGTGSTVLTLNTGFIDVTAAGAAYTNYVRILPNRPTILDNWKLTIDFKITAWDASANAFALICKSTNTHIQNDFLAYTTTANTGTASLAMSNASGAAYPGTPTGTGATNHLNDIVELTLSLVNDTTFVFTQQNLTTSSSVTTLTYNVPLAATSFLPNTCTWGFTDFGDAGSTHQIRKIEISSTSVANPSWLLAGPSIPQGYFASSYAGRLGNQLNVIYPTFEIWADGGGQSTDILARIQELIKLNPQHVLCVACNVNDITYGVAGGLTNAQATAVAMVNIDSINNILTAAGIDVWYATTPQDSTQGGTSLGALNNAMKAKFPTRTIPYWDSLTTAGNNILRPAFQHTDHIHINQAGQNQMVTTTIAANVVKTIDIDRRSPIRVTGQVVSGIFGDSLMSQINVPFGYAGIGDGKGGLRSGLMIDNTATAIFSRNQLFAKSFLSTTVLGVDGGIQANGINSALSVNDRSDNTKFVNQYYNAAIYRVINFNGTDYTGVNTAGDWLFTGGGSLDFGNVSVGIRTGIFLKKNQTGAGDAWITKGWGLTIDSATITYTGTGPITEGALVKFNIPTITAASGINATHSATVTIAGPPTFTGSATSSDNSALRIASGALEIGFDATHWGTITGGSAGGLIVQTQGTGGVQLNLGSNGALNFQNPGSFLFFNGGANSRAGTTTLVAGTKTITITGVANSSIPLITIISQGTSALTTEYIAVCGTNTLTISAVTAAGNNTVNTADVSNIGYLIIN